MVTVTFSTNKTHATEIAAQLKADKKIKHVEILQNEKEDILSSYNLVRPGRPLTDAELERLVNEAEAEPEGMPFNQAVKEIRQHYKSFEIKNRTNGRKKI